MKVKIRTTYSFCDGDAYLSVRETVSNIPNTADVPIVLAAVSRTSGSAFESSRNCSRREKLRECFQTRSFWSGRWDLNPGPLAPHAVLLAWCAKFSCIHLIAWQVYKIVLVDY